MCTAEACVSYPKTYRGWTKASSFQDLNSDCQSMLSRFLIVLGFQIRDLWKLNINIFASKGCACPQKMDVYNNDVFSFRFSLRNVFLGNTDSENYKKFSDMRNISGLPFYFLK